MNNPASIPPPPNPTLYRTVRRIVKGWIIEILFYVLRIVPLKNKVVATTFKGRKYGDNPQFILEKLRELDPSIDFVWLRDSNLQFPVPSWMRPVEYFFGLKPLYEMATAKVWINTHRLQKHTHKRPGQLFVETWHGGLGIKKVELDVPAFQHDESLIKELKLTCQQADVFISQSKHLSTIYRRAFGYKGPIWRCGFPKNDSIFTKDEKREADFREKYGFGDKKIFLYAPSFRDNFKLRENPDFSIYDVDYERLEKALQQRFGGEWAICVRWHPLKAWIIQPSVHLPSTVTDLTDFPDMQELITYTDILLSDYSSCIFDAALRRIPCLTFATDFEKFCADRGVYYQMEELPFPYARNNDELIDNILHFDQKDYLDRWDAFTRLTGLVETGHAAADIAGKIYEFMQGHQINWNELDDKTP
jgi:CDP-glycerol glycerophosphotransferase